VGKSKLFGQYTDPGPEAGDWSDLTYKGKILGAVLRTKRNVSCVYVSIGHRAVLASAIELVMRCVRKHRIPEPTRLAHEAVNQFRREHSAGDSQEDAS
jgi:deoxyribonuclease V